MIIANDQNHTNVAKSILYFCKELKSLLRTANEPPNNQNNPNIIYILAYTNIQ